MALSQKQNYTEDDYYNIPEDVRAELIDGQIYYQAAPSRIHQEILSEVHTAINNFQDKVKVNIYDDLWIDFHEVTL